MTHLHRNLCGGLAVAKLVVLILLFRGGAPAPGVLREPADLVRSIGPQCTGLLRVVPLPDRDAIVAADFGHDFTFRKCTP